MSISSQTPPPAQIEYVRDIPKVFLSGRLDTSTSPAFDGLVASLFTQPNPRILMDKRDFTFVGSLGQCSIFELIRQPAVCSRTATLSIPPMVLEVLESLGFPGLLDMYPDRECILNGGRS
jgi:anti-anti-sigma regulatory factor